MKEVDYLAYTWARRGLEGQNRFQIVAATPGLEPGTQLASEALTYCRYDVASNGSRLPISFGWVIRDGLRWVFHRGPSATGTGWHRPGNFLAHVVVGPPEDLPIREVVRRFDSPFWFWNDRELIGTVARLTLDEVPCGSVTPSHTAEVRPLLSYLLSAGRASAFAVRAEPSAFVSLILRAELSVPGLFGSLSVSTFEPGEPVAPFNLLGVPGQRHVSFGLQTITSDEDPEVDQAFRRAADVALSDEESMRSRVVAVVNACREGHTSFDFREFTALITALDGIETLDIDRLLPALHEPTTAVIALARRDIRKLIIKALDGPQAPLLLTTLYHVARYVDPTFLEAFADELGGSLKYPRQFAVLDEVLGILRTVPSADEACLIAVLRTLGSRPSLARGIPATLRLSLLRVASRGECDPVLVETLIDEADAVVAREIEQDRRWPLQWRARSIARILVTPSEIPAYVPSLLRRERDLLHEVARRLRDWMPLIRTILTSDEVSGSLIARNLIPALPPEERPAFLHALPPRMRLSALEEALFDLRARDRSSFGSLIVDTVVANAAMNLDLTDVDPVPDSRSVALLRALRGQEVDPWVSLVESLRSLTSGEWVDKRVERAIAAMSTAKQRAIARDLLFFTGMAAVTTVEQINDLAGRAQQDPARDTAKFLERALVASRWHTRSRHRNEPAIAALLLVSAAVESKRLHVSKGRLVPERLHQLCQDASAQLSDAEAKLVLAELRGAHRRTRRWWRDLAKHS